MSTYAQLASLGDWRRRELTRLKAILPPAENATFETLCRGMLVLCYSHWEGYFNDLTDEVFRRASVDRLSTAHFGAEMRCLFLKSEIDRLAASRFSSDSMIKFLQAIELSQYGRKSIDLQPVKSRSSLNSERLTTVAQVYGVSWIEFERKRIFIDHKLCRLRHEIAHGDAPRLTRDLALEIADKTLELLDDLVDYFNAVQIRLTA